MKTSTVIGIAVLAALGLGAYYIYTKSKTAAAAAVAATPGAIATNAVGLAATGASLLGGIVGDIGGVFSGAAPTQSVPTSIITAPATGPSDYADLTDPSLSVLGDF